MSESQLSTTGNRSEAALLFGREGGALMEQKIPAGTKEHTDVGWGDSQS